MAASLPIPTYPSTPPTIWGSKPYAGQSSGTLRDLIGWGDTAPAPLQLNAIERIAASFYGGWIQCEAGDTNSAWAPDGSVIDMHTATKEGTYGRWANAGNDGLWHGIAACWASDPSLTFFAAPKAGTYLPEQVRWGSLAYPAGADSTQGDGVQTATNLYGWGGAALPAARLSQIEVNAIKQSGSNAGWAKVEGPNGSGVISLLDARYSKNPDGTWQNRNDASAKGMLGLVTDVASKPKNGVAGYIDTVEHDVANNPLGAVLLVIVAVPLAALAPALLAFGEADALAIGVSQAVGSSAILDANKFVATHPAEVGEAAAGAELAIAGAVLGAKGLSALGGQLLGGALGSSIPPDANQNTSGPTSTPSAGKRWWQLLTGG